MSIKTRLLLNPTTKLFTIIKNRHVDDQITQIEISTAVEAMVSYHFNL